MLCPRAIEQGIGPDSPFVTRGEGGNGKQCTYCGSASGDVFMAACEDGTAKLGPTDKSYKVYVEGIPGIIKFYFQHLSVDQCKRFVELLNEKKLNIGSPGHFYVKPFFIG